MTALAKDRSTPMKGDARQISMKVAAGEQIYKGAIVAVSATGFLEAATDVAGKLVAGIADQNVDNTGGADGDVSCIVLKGTAGLRADGTNPTQAEIGRAVYVQDDGNVQTLAAAANNIKAGHLDSIQDGLYWTRLFDQA